MTCCMGAARLGAVVVGLVGAAGSALAAEPVELKLKWPVGRRCVYRVTTAQDVRIQGPGGGPALVARYRETQTLSLSVLRDVEGGGRLVELQIQALKVETGLGTATVRFDSSSDPKTDEDNVLARLLRKMVGAKFRFVVDFSSRITAVQGQADLLKRIYDEMPPRLQADANMMLKQATQAFEEEGLKRLGPLGAAPLLPAGAVRVRDGWPVKRDISLTGMGSMRMAGTCRFTGWEPHGPRRCAVIECTGELGLDLSGSGPAADAVSMKRGVLSARVLVDPQAGLLVRYTASQKVALIQKPGDRKASNPAGAVTADFQQKVDVEAVEIGTVSAASPRPS